MWWEISHRVYAKQTVMEERVHPDIGNVAQRWGVPLRTPVVDFELGAPHPREDEFGLDFGPGVGLP